MLDQRHVSCEKPGEGRMARGQEAAPLEVMWYKAWGLTEGKGWKSFIYILIQKKILKPFTFVYKTVLIFQASPQLSSI